MNWLKNILGMYDRKQIQRTQEVTEIFHEKRNDYIVGMKKLQIQAKKVHAQASKTTTESAKLITMVVDVTTKIAIATGSLKDE